MRDTVISLRRKIRDMRKAHNAEVSKLRSDLNQADSLLVESYRRNRISAEGYFKLAIAMEDMRGRANAGN
ncbi:MAG: hypothetical protein H0X25_12500 [Acidobacteriales bacterium]|nr:hypothetical protein [Terriglobales bacterium]